MSRVLEFAVLALLWLLPCLVLAQAPEDDLAAEFKGAKLVHVSQHVNRDSFNCTLYTDAEYKQLKEQAIKHKANKGATGNSPLYGKYVILEVKRDRLVLVPEIWTDQPKVRVIPLRYISEIYRAGLYDEAK